MRYSCLVILLLFLTPACQKSPLGDASGGDSARNGGGDKTGFGTPSEILDKAILAYGGDSAEQRLKTCRINYRTVAKMPKTGENARQNAVLTEDCYLYPDRLRRVVRNESDGKQVLLTVVSGNQMWLLPANGELMTKPCQPEMACPSAIATLGRLMRLRTIHESMTTEPVEQIDGREVLPLTVLQDNVPQITIYFDLSNWLVVKEVRYMPDPEKLPEGSGRKPLMETTYGDYKRFDGVMLPTLVRASQGDQLGFEARILGVEFLLGFPPEFFEMPKTDQPSNQKPK